MLLTRTGRLIERLRAFLREGHPLVQLRALLLLALGWLLSPLCWWNDLVFNLPIAWVFGKALQFVNPAWFTPGLVIGYWFSNLAGILLMQSSAMAVFRGEDEERDRRRELWTGLALSSVYTVVIFGLVRLGVLQTPLPDGG